MDCDLHRSADDLLIIVPVSRLQSAQKVVRSGAPSDAVFVADVALGRSGALDTALQSSDALIIATSAVPQVLCYTAALGAPICDAKSER